MTPEHRSDLVRLLFFAAVVFALLAIAALVAPWTITWFLPAAVAALAAGIFVRTW
jgi:hypothetical protein